MTDNPRALSQSSACRRDGCDKRWWQASWWAIIAGVIAAVPLIGLALPPLTDLPGHIGRYRIVAEAGLGPLARYYTVHHGLVGNLGVDLFVAAIHPLIDVEQAAHFAVIFIPALFVTSLWWASHEAHGRTAPLTIFAFPLAYSMPFQLGFVNFTASAALAISALALWIRLAKRWPDQVRIVLFIPIAGIVWLCHSFGWAIMGLTIFGAELVIRSRRSTSYPLVFVGALAACAPMAWPQVVSMIQGAGPVGQTGDWLDIAAKAQWVASMLRERWKVYDVVSVIILASLMWAAIRDQRLRFEPILGVPSALCFCAFVALPRIYAGGSYVDMRMLPYATALGIAAITTRTTNPSLQMRLALAGLSFFVLRIVTSTIALDMFARDQTAELQVLPYIPNGTSVLSLVKEPIPSDWTNERLSHIAGIAIAERRIFTNEQWSIPGQQLITPINLGAAPFDRDPSQIVFPANSDIRSIGLDKTIAAFNRSSFAYVWTIGFPRRLVKSPDLIPVWSNNRSTLYKVVPMRGTAVPLVTPK